LFNDPLSTFESSWLVQHPAVGTYMPCGSASEGVLTVCRWQCLMMSPAFRLTCQCCPRVEKLSVNTTSASRCHPSFCQACCQSSEGESSSTWRCCWGIGSASISCWLLHCGSAGPSWLLCRKGRTRQGGAHCGTTSSGQHSSQHVMTTI
jgi:hypothetical protein